MQYGISYYKDIVLHERDFIPRSVGVGPKILATVWLLPMYTNLIRLVGPIR